MIFDIGYKKFVDISQANIMLGEIHPRFSHEGEDLVIETNKSKIVMKGLVKESFDPFVVDINGPLMVFLIGGAVSGKVEVFIEGDQIHFSHKGTRAKFRNLINEEKIKELCEPKELLFEGIITANELDILSKRLNIGESMGIETTENVFISSIDKESAYLLSTDGYVTYRHEIKGEKTKSFVSSMGKDSFKPIRYLIRCLPKALTKKDYKFKVYEKSLMIEGDELKIISEIFLESKDNLKEEKRYNMGIFFTQIRKLKEVDGEIIYNWDNFKISDFDSFKEKIKSIKKENEEKMIKIEKDKLIIFDESLLLIVDEFEITSNIEELEKPKKSLIGVLKHLKEISLESTDGVFFVKDFKIEGVTLVRKDLDNGSYIFSLGKTSSKK